MKNKEEMKNRNIALIWRYLIYTRYGIFSMFLNNVVKVRTNLLK